jgi:two-component system sensor histidine kinase AgrC
MNRGVVLMAQALIALLFQPTFSPCHVIDILLILMGLIWLSSEVKFLLVFLLIFLVVAFFRHRQLLSQQQHEISITYDYTQSLEKANEDFRYFKHDYQNVLASLAFAIQNGNLQEVSCAYETLVSSSLTTLPNQKSLNIHLIGDPNLRSLLLVKHRLATDTGVTFSIDLLTSCDSQISLNLYRTIAILLDNAIEAAEKTQEKLVCLTLQPLNNLHVIQITNSIDQPFATNHLTKSGFSSKQGHSGIGLTFVKHYVNHQPDVSLRTTLSHDTFTQTLTFGATNEFLRT